MANETFGRSSQQAAAAAAAQTNSQKGQPNGIAPLDSSGVVPAANALVKSVAGRTGTVTVASTDLTDSTATGRSLLTATSATSALATLGGVALSSGTTGQTLTGRNVHKADPADTNYAAHTAQLQSGFSTSASLYRGLNASGTQTFGVSGAGDISGASVTLDTGGAVNLFESPQYGRLSRLSASYTGGWARMLTGIKHLGDTAPADMGSVIGGVSAYGSSTSLSYLGLYASPTNDAVKWYSAPNIQVRTDYTVRFLGSSGSATATLDGNAGSLALTALTASGTIAAASLKPTPIPVASLPPASANSGVYYQTTNIRNGRDALGNPQEAAGAGTGGWARSDGTNWRNSVGVVAAT